MRRYGWLYLPGIVFLLLSSYIGALAPSALGRAIDLLERPGVAHAEVLRQALYIMGIALGTFVTRFIWRQFIIGNSRNMQIFLRQELFQQLQRLPVPFFNHAKTGDLMAYAINDVNAVRQTFGPAVSLFISGVSTSLFSVTAMLSGTEPRLTIIALLPVIPAFAAIFVIGGHVRRKFRRVQEQFAHLSGRVQENISGMRVLKAFVQEEDQIVAFDGMSGKMRDLNVDLATTSATLSPIISVLFGLSAFTCILYGGNLVLRGGISIGDFVAFSAYLGMIQTPVVQTGRIVNLVQRGLASFRRLASVIDEPGIPREEESLEGAPERMDIELRGLSFTYPDGATPVLSNVNAFVPQGGSLGVCGPTGCGKTTLVSLLLKSFQPPPGTVFIGGKDIRDIPAHALRELIGYVPQDGFLFNTTLRDNIVFFAPGVTEEDVSAAVRASGLYRDMASFPEGLNTMAGERGAHLSGGQKQRVAIARALIRKPRLLLLDDALSAVDTHTEKLVLRNLQTEMQTRTAVIVAHRLSAVEHCTSILYMEHGAVLECGSHDELLRQNGAYAALYHKQMEEGEQG